MKIVAVILFCLTIQFGYSQTLEESLELVANLSDSTQSDSLIKLSRLSAIEDRGDVGLRQSRWALTMSQKRGFKDLIPKARFYVARNYNQINQTDSAIFHYQKGLKEAENTKSEGWRIFFITALANNFRQKGDFKNSIDIQLNALKDFQNELDSFFIAKLHTEIGYTYDRMKEFNVAIEYHRKALQYLDTNSASYINFIYGRIAIANDELVQYDSAHYYNQKVLRYCVENGDSSEIGPTCSNIGNTYLKQEKWIKSRIYLERAKRLNLIHGDDGNKAITFINLGTVYTNLGHYTEAEVALDKGVSFSKSWNNSKFLSEAYFFKSKLFSNIERHDSALFYFKQYKVIEDSLYNLDKLNQIKEINAKYETEKKEQQIEIQNVSLAKKESQLVAKQRTIFALIVLSILIIVISFAIYKRYKAQKNAEVQKRIIEEQEKGLQAVFIAQEDERKRISKDLHDGIGQQLSGLKMAIQTASSRLTNQTVEEKTEFEKLAKIASDSADEVRLISHQMMPRALTELGLVEAISDMLDKSLGLSDIEYEFEHFRIEKRLEEKIEISLYRITQELINNIIKHSLAQKVNIQLFKNQGKIILVVEDDGKGMKPSNSDGHGLLNMRNRINTLHGEMNLEPSPTSGTLATIRIPI